MNQSSRSESEYDLTSVEVPVLKGVPLKVVAALLESPLRGLVTAVLARKFGLPRFRKMKFDEAPTFFLSTWQKRPRRRRSKSQRISGRETLTSRGRDSNS